MIVLPWHNPVLLAEQAATLDLISGGRLDFGIGKGYRHSEFTGFCIPPEEAEARFEESIEVITRSWLSRERFSHRGRFWRFEDIVVEPPPAQKPHPPFWVAAGSEASIRRAAKRGFNLILDQYASPEPLGERIALYRSEREAHGHRLRSDAGRGRAPALRRQGLAPTRRRRSSAQAAAHPAHGRCVARAGRQGAGSHVLSYAGTRRRHRGQCALRHARRDLRASSKRCKRAGVDYVLLTILGGQEQLRRFAREIMPAVAGRPGHTPAAVAAAQQAAIEFSKFRQFSWKGDVTLPTLVIA